MIKQVRMQGFKGRNDTIQIPELCLITGNNAQGKSTIRDAIMLGVFGEHPDVPKTNPGAFLFASESTMCIDIEATEFSIARKWTRKGEKVSADVIQDKEIAFPIGALDASSFIKLPIKEKIALVSDLLGEGDDEKVREEVLKLVEPIGDKSEELANLIKPDVMGELANADWILKLIDVVKELQLEAGRTVKRHTGAVQATTENQSDEVPIKPDESEINDAVADIARLREQLKGIEKEAEESQKFADLIEERAQLLEIIGNHVRKDVEAQIARANEALQRSRENRARIEAEILNLRSDESRLNREMVRLENEGAEVDDVAPVPDEPEMSRAEAESIFQQAGSEYDDTNSAIVRIQEARRIKAATLGALKGKQCCPTCGADASHINGIVETLTAEIEEIDQDLASKNATLATAKKRRDDAEVTITEHKNRDIVISSNERLNKAHEEYQTKIERARRDWQTANDRLTEKQSELEELPRDHEQPKTAILEAIQRFDVITASLPNGEPPDQLAMAQKAGSLEQQIERQEERLADLNARKEAWQEWRAAVREAEKASAVAREAEAEKVQYKGILEKLDKHAKAVTVGRFSDLLKPFKPLLGKFIGDIEVDPDDWTLGRHTARGWVSWKTFSGAEQILLQTGLQLAIASKTVLRAVMIDELSRLDKSNKRAMVSNLLKVREAGLIEQIILIDHDAEFYAKEFGEIPQIRM